MDIQISSNELCYQNPPSSARSLTLVHHRCPNPKGCAEVLCTSVQWLQEVCFRLSQSRLVPAIKPGELDPVEMELALKHSKSQCACYVVCKAYFGLLSCWQVILPILLPTPFTLCNIAQFMALCGACCDCRTSVQRMHSVHCSSDNIRINSAVIVGTVTCEVIHIHAG